MSEYWAIACHYCGQDPAFMVRLAENGAEQDLYFCAACFERLEQFAKAKNEHLQKYGSEIFGRN